jgi:hypothetical protein
MLSGDKVGFLKNKDDSIAAVYMADGVQKTLNLSSGTVDACWTDLDQPPVVVGTVLTATPGVNYVILHWTAVRGAVKWKILRSTGTDSNWTEIANDVTSQFNAFSDATVINGTLYFYKVQGLNDKGAVVVTSNQTGGWRPQLPPAAPTLTAVAGDATVSLKWSWPKGATCTDVLRSFSHDGPWIEIADGYTSGNYTYIDRNVVNGTTYFYKIKHVNNNTTPGADSNVVGGITPQRNPAAIESEHATR